MNRVTKPPAGDRPIKTLERMISKAGLGSRTEARKWIAAGRVEVNGTVVRDPDQWIDMERDTLLFDGAPLTRQAPIYLLLHKPVGYLTTYDDKQKRPTIYDLLPHLETYVFPVGRLDLDTSGLLILTNDTAFAERTNNPEYKVPKTYRVEASTALTDAQLDQLREGIELRDGPTRPAHIERSGHGTIGTVFHITITEGRNRQVRRMVEALGAEVVSLERIAIGAVVLADLPSGETRELDAEELDSLRR